MTHVHAADRRADNTRLLRPPESAIPSEEDAVSIDSAMAMRLAFLKDDRAEAGAVLALLDALVELLIGDGRRR